MLDAFKSCCGGGGKKAAKKDKSKKRPGRAPSPAPQDATPARSMAGSLTGEGESSADRRSPASVLAAEQLAGQGQSGPELVIENKAAVDANENTADHPYPQYNSSDDQKPLTNADVNVSSLPATEAAVSGQPVNYFQNLPSLDDRYSPSLVKTPIADAVTSEGIGVTARERSKSQPGAIEQRVSQLDTKITTFEEKTPVTQEMVTEEGAANAPLPMSVSSKSLEKAVMFAPELKSKNKTVSLSGVDNSIPEVNGTVDEVIHMKTDTDPQTLSYSRTASLSSESSRGLSLTPPTVKADKSSSAGREENDQLNSLDKSDLSISVSGADNSLSVLPEGEGTTLQLEVTDEVCPVEAGISMSQPVSDIQRPPGEGIPANETKRIKDLRAGNQKSDNHSIDLNDDIAPNDVTAGDTKEEDNKGSVDSAGEIPEAHFAPNKHTNSKETDSGANLPGIGKETESSDGRKLDETVPEVTVSMEESDIKPTGSGTHFTEFYSPARMERELTPDSLVMDTPHSSYDSAKEPKSNERSEMKFLIGVDKRLSSNVETGSDNSMSDSHSVSSIERSEYYAPPRIERELTPDLSTHTTSSAQRPNNDSFQRSEIHLELGGQKTPSEPEVNKADVEIKQNPSDILKNVEIVVGTKDSTKETDVIAPVSANETDLKPENSAETLESEKLASEDKADSLQNVEIVVGTEDSTKETDVTAPVSTNETDVKPENLAETLKSKKPASEDKADSLQNVEIVVGTEDSTKETDVTAPVSANETAVKPENLAETLKSKKPASEDKADSLQNVEIVVGTEDSTKETDVTAPVSANETDVKPENLAEILESEKPASEDKADRLTTELEKESTTPLAEVTQALQVETSAPFDSLDTKAFGHNSGLEKTASTDSGSKDGDSKPLNDSTSKDSDSTNADITRPNEGRPGSASDIQPKEARIVNAQISITEAEPSADGLPLEQVEKKSPREDTELLQVKDEHADENSSVSSEGLEYSRKQMTETEEVIETSVEETVTMVITGVVSNPGEDEEIILSMQDAVSQGLLDLQNGLYHNKSTGKNISMIDAMNMGYIKMGPKKVEKSEEKVKSVGIITIHTTRETTPYKVKAAKDTRDGNMYHTFQATRRKILDSDKGTFTDLKTGSKMLMGDAIDLGLVEVEYDTSAAGTVQEEISQTYSVHAVVDQKARTKIPFHEAVSRGLIDSETGEYIHNISNIRVPVAEAISRGFIKATLADSAEDISVDNMGSKVAEQGVEAIRKKLVNPLHAVNQMKP